MSETTREDQVLNYLTILANQFPTMASVTSEIVNLSAILALPAPTEQFISDLHGVLDAVDHGIRNGSGSIRRTIEECFRFSMSQHERDELATVIYYPRDKVMQLLKVRQQRRHASDLIAEQLAAEHAERAREPRADKIREKRAAPSLAPLVGAEKLDDESFYQLLLYRLVVVARVYAERYTRSRVNKVLHLHVPDWAYIMNELFAQLEQQECKRGYLESILCSIISTGCAPAFIVAISTMIRVLAIDQLFVVGDIFDRGPHAHLLLERLMQHHHITLEFGNHDVLWLGAACGSDACIANVLRVSLRYGLFETLEHFGINLMPLLRFARATYEHDPCAEFQVRGSMAKKLGEREARDAAMMHKAITVIQFKLEQQVIARHPCWKMERRNILHRIRGLDERRAATAAAMACSECSVEEEDCAACHTAVPISDLPPLTVELPSYADEGGPPGGVYEMLDSFFPTITPDDEYCFTADEKDIVLKMRHLFLESRPLQTGARWIYENGAMFHEHNGLLIFHGGIPVDADGDFLDVQIYDSCTDDDKLNAAACKPLHRCRFRGRELFEEIDKCMRDAFYLRDADGAFVNADDTYKSAALSVRPLNAATGLSSLAEIEELGQPSRDELRSRQVFGRDLAWWLWCGPESPLFGRDRMATFENYFISDPQACKERGTPYYSLREQREYCEHFIRQWGLDPNSTRIVSGHTPVKMRSGENPLKGDGLCIVIDGGFVTPAVTGVAGFTLVCDSNQLTLSGHKPFPGRRQAIDTNEDLCSDVTVLDRYTDPRRVRDTDVGATLRKRVDDLKALLSAYKIGLIKQKR